MTLFETTAELRYSVLRSSPFRSQPQNVLFAKVMFQNSPGGLPMSSAV